MNMYRLTGCIVETTINRTVARDIFRETVIRISFYTAGPIKRRFVNRENSRNEFPRNENNRFYRLVIPFTKTFFNP